MAEGATAFSTDLTGFYWIWKVVRRTARGLGQVAEALHPRMRALLPAAKVVRPKVRPFRQAVKGFRPAVKALRLPEFPNGAFVKVVLRP
jgi:hypothetical protein